MSMFNTAFIPKGGSKVKKLLAKIYDETGANETLKAAAENKLAKVDRTLQEKIVNVFTTAEYFDDLWSQDDLHEGDKNFAINQLEKIQRRTFQEIQEGTEEVAPQPANLDHINAAQKIAPYDEYVIQQKMKDIPNLQVSVIDTVLSEAYETGSLDVHYAVNKPSYTVKNSKVRNLIHYKAGLCDPNDEEELKRQQAVSFIKNMKKEQREYRKKLKEITDQNQSKELQQLERAHQKEQAKNNQEIEEKRQRMLAHIAELKDKRENRAKEAEEWEQKYKAAMDSKPLYKRIEDRFNNETLMPELEERKRKLQELRDFHKPIREKDLNKHEKKIQKMLKKLEKAKEKKAAEEAWEYKKPDYESVHHKEWVKEMKQVRHAKEEEQYDTMKKREKIEQLMEEVKYRYVPKPSAHKELEMAILIEEMKNHVEKPLFTDKRSKTSAVHLGMETEPKDPRELGKGYLKALRDIPKKKKLPKAKKVEGGVEPEKRAESVPPTSRARSNDMHSGRVEAAAQSAVFRIKKHNYLEDLRKDKKLQTSEDHVDSLIKNMKIKEGKKVELLTSEVAKLEEKAKKLEQVRKHKIKSNRPAELLKDNELDELYINTIKAKLEMLSH